MSISRQPYFRDYLQTGRIVRFCVRYIDYDGQMVSIGEGDDTHVIGGGCNAGCIGIGGAGLVCDNRACRKLTLYPSGRSGFGHKLQEQSCVGGAEKATWVE